MVYQPQGQTTPQAEEASKEVLSASDQALRLEVPYDAPYSSPAFEDLDLSALGKSLVSRPTSILSITGLSAPADTHGRVERIFLSNGSEIAVEKWEDILSLCLEGGASHIYATYDSHTLDCILRLLPLDALLELIVAPEKGYTIEGAEGNARIWYTPDHKLTIRTHNTTAKIQVLSRWDKRRNLEQTAKRYGLRWNPSDKWNEACAVERLGNAIKSRLEEMSPHLPIGDLSSPSALTNILLSRTLSQHSARGIPKDALRAAYECLHAPWLEIFAQGSWENAWDYDLDSAYPTEIAKLTPISPWLGAWLASSEYQPRATYGFCQAFITMLPAEGAVSPIRLRRLKTSKLYSPYYEWCGHITKDEIDYIHHNRLGSVEVLSGWWYIPTPEGRTMRPFEKQMHTLVEKRRKVKDNDPLQADILKALATRLNGHFLRKREVPFSDTQEVGANFNPVYATTVMTRTKLKLAGVAREAQVKGARVLAVTVDGLIVDKPLDKRDPAHPRPLGGLKLEGMGRTIIASPFTIDIEGKENGHGLRDELEKDGWKREYELGDEVRVPLIEAVERKRPDFIGRVEGRALTVKVGGDYSHHWEARPHTGEDLLTRQYFGEQIASVVASPPEAWEKSIKGPWAQEDPEEK